MAGLCRVWVADVGALPARPGTLCLWCAMNFL
jgi:hypothetical protein